MHADLIVVNVSVRYPFKLVYIIRIKVSPPRRKQTRGVTVDRVFEVHVDDRARNIISVVPPELRFVITGDIIEPIKENFVQVADVLKLDE